MQIIRDSLLPEQLDAFRKAIEAEPEESSEDRAQRLDAEIRAKVDALAEQEDRNRHERRKAAALARKEHASA